MDDKPRLTETVGFDVVDGSHHRHLSANMRCQLMDRECLLLAKTGGPEPVLDTAEVPPAPEVRTRTSALVRVTSALALTPDVDQARR